MLKSVKVTDDDDGDTYVEFFGDGESDEKSFWLRGLALLERAARMCLETRVDQMIEDRQADLLASPTKKAA